MVVHEFSGTGVPTGAAITYGVAGPFLISANQIAEYLHDAFDDSVLNQLSDDISLSRTLVKEGPSETGPSGEFADVRQGSISGSNAAPAFSCLVRKITASGGRKGRGRWFLPGMVEANVAEGGDINVTYLGNLNADLEVFRDFIDTDGGLPMVLLHNDLTTPTVVTALQAQQIGATQRRRQRR